MQARMRMRMDGMKINKVKCLKRHRRKEFEYSVKKEEKYRFI